MRPPPDGSPPVYSLRTGYAQWLNLKPTALYRFYDAEGRLLYAGVTMDTKRRFGEHSRDKDWWPLVARKEVEWYDDRASAEEAEALAIRDEKPVYDATHRIGNGYLKYPRVSHGDG